jgi:hypothetical protein
LLASSVSSSSSSTHRLPLDGEVGIGSAIYFQKRICAGKQKEFRQKSEETGCDKTISNAAKQTKAPNGKRNATQMQCCALFASSSSCLLCAAFHGVGG